jgi:hypothetical protein
MTRTTITRTNTEGEIPRIETLTHVTPHQPTWRDRACEIATDEDAPLELHLAPPVDLIERSALSETARGAGGFGSTGL